MIVSEKDEDEEECDAGKPGNPGNGGTCERERGDECCVF